MLVIMTCNPILLLLLSIFQSNTTGSVYRVTPDGYRNTTCHHCQNLRYYQLNATKYFTSNTQLLFLPGLHQLHTDLIIQNVHNFSLTGESITKDKIPKAVIQCEYHAGISIKFIEITNLTITRLVIQNCISEFVSQQGSLKSAVLFIKECNPVILHQLHIHKGDPCYPSNALMTVNIMGKLSHILCYGIIMYNIEPSTKAIMVYNATTFYVSIKHYTPYDRDYCDSTSLINLNVKQKSYGLIMQLANIVTSHLPSNSHLLYSEISGTITIQIVECKVINCYFEIAFDFHFMYVKSASEAMIQFSKCQFISNIASNGALLRIDAEIQPSTDKVWLSVLNCLFYNNVLNNSLITLCNTNAEFSTCYFLNNSNSLLLQSQFIGEKPGSLLLQNSSFFYNSANNETNLMNTSNIFLSFMNKIIFYENNFRTIINPGSFSVIMVSQAELNFSCNIAFNIIDFRCKECVEFIIITEAKLVFFKNHVCSIFGMIQMAFPLCIFQYYGIKASSGKQHNWSSVIFQNNFYNSHHCYNHIPIRDCRWLEDSAFANFIPIDVNNKYIKYVNSSGMYNMTQQNYDHRTICLCDKVNSHMKPDCSKNQLGYLYPGQTLNIYVYVNKHFNTSKTRVKIDFESEVTQLYVPTCIIIDAYKKMEVLSSTCTRVNNTIVVFPNDTKCALYMKIFGDLYDNLNLFYIKPLPCPPGFIKANQICACYPKLIKFGVLGCNLNDQTILRPANSWISTTAYNNSYIYQISLQCPFHYCLSHLSHLNLSNPNSQCHFNRCGVLCGQCLEGFSTIFASNKCQHCPNSYLFLIIPIAIAGLVLVLMLFILNLTVTDGTMNAFILYVHITGINASVLFDNFTVANTLTSLANLDLGIQTCFYNGMDDYVKMWLQLAFPSYLIFIATLLIIASRYSTRIQRLTARRALPVLATLFLLSYTKILITVSSILFSYSTVTQLPSERSTIVWSIDANVSVLGLRFIILFTACLLIFLLQVPFSIILLFNRPLQRFYYINKFKPLLDAYQGPYKDELYYWTGIQLVIRVVFLGISTLNTTTYFKASNFIIALMCALTGILHPFKSKYQNYQEQLVFLNLQALHIFAQQNTHMTIMHIVNVFAAVHFSLIVTYHIITYMCGGLIRYRIQQTVNNIKRRMTNRFTEHRLELCNVPEVAFNYREYREPLVGY